MVAMLKVSPVTDLPSTGGWLGGRHRLDRDRLPDECQRTETSSSPGSFSTPCAVHGRVFRQRLLPPFSGTEQQKQAVADQVVTAGQIIHAVPFPPPHQVPIDGKASLPEHLN